MSQEENNPFEELTKALTEDREKILKEVQEVYDLLTKEINDFLKRCGRQTTVEPSLEILNPYRITGKIIIESKEYDEYILKNKYVGKINDFELVITVSKYYSSIGKSVLELQITAYKPNNENIIRKDEDLE